MHFFKMFLRYVFWYISLVCSFAFSFFVYMKEQILDWKLNFQIRARLAMRLTWHVSARVLVEFLVTDRLLGAWMWNAFGTTHLLCLPLGFESRKTWELAENRTLKTAALRYYIGFEMHTFFLNIFCLPHVPDAKAAVAASLRRLPLYVLFVSIDFQRDTHTRICLLINLSLRSLIF